MQPIKFNLKYTKINILNNVYLPVDIFQLYITLGDPQFSKFASIFWLSRGVRGGEGC